MLRSVLPTAIPVILFQTFTLCVFILFVQLCSIRKSILISVMIQDRSILVTFHCSSSDTYDLGGMWPSKAFIHYCIGFILWVLPYDSQCNIILLILCDGLNHLVLLDSQRGLKDPFLRFQEPMRAPHSPLILPAIILF